MNFKRDVEKCKENGGGSCNWARRPADAESFSLRNRAHDDGWPGFGGRGNCTR
ncbi:hypothetical protein WN55_06793 [Dufourea novaeangliae]|uniref:Uncharacterized protein n=1 Tax=Dufourea novaeangliae TaxID=178035 RepID=A0A154PR52_DUFNO|nr:hypothetical protein WN55_06793 [Dufourea novaeangliae]